jgi:hypothetical protein
MWVRDGWWVAEVGWEWAVVYVGVFSLSTLVDILGYLCPSPTALKVQTVYGDPNRKTSLLGLTSLIHSSESTQIEQQMHDLSVRQIGIYWVKVNHLKGNYDDGQHNDSFHGYNQ